MKPQHERIEKAANALSSAGDDLAAFLGLSEQELAEVYLHLFAGHLAATCPEEQLTHAVETYGGALPRLVTDYLKAMCDHPEVAQ